MPQCEIKFSIGFLSLFILEDSKHHNSCGKINLTAPLFLSFL